DLVVEPGPHPLLAGVEEHGAVGGEVGLLLLAEKARRLQAVEDVLAFPIAFRRHVVDVLEERRARPQQLVDLVLAPNVELALLMLAVGVEAREAPAFRMRHLAPDPFDRLADALLEKR